MKKYKADKIKSKDLVKGIIKDIEKENKLNVRVFPSIKLICILDAINEELKCKKHSFLDKLEVFKELLKFNKGSYVAYYDDIDNTIRIYLDLLLMSCPTKKIYLWNLIRTTFHEYKHALVHSGNNDTIKTLEDFYLLIDRYLYCNTNYYSYGYNEFYEEAIAEKYSIENSLKQIDKYPEIDTETHQYIYLDAILSDISYYNFDIEKNLNILDELKLEHPLNNNSIIDDFYNEDGLLKSLKDLSKIDSWNNLPIEVNFLIISTINYLYLVDYKYLSKEELNFIANAIHYSLSLVNKRQIKNKQLKAIYNRLDENAYQDNIILKKGYLKIGQTLDNKEKETNEKLYFLSTELNKVLDILETKLYKKKILIKDTNPNL